MRTPQKRGLNSSCPEGYAVFASLKTLAASSIFQPGISHFYFRVKWKVSWDHNLHAEKTNSLLLYISKLHIKGPFSSVKRILHTSQQDCNVDHKIYGVMTSNEEQHIPVLADSVSTTKLCLENRCIGHMLLKNV